jgi:hypothetical protein
MFKWKDPINIKWDSPLGTPTTLWPLYLWLQCFKCSMCFHPKVQFGPSKNLDSINLEACNLIMFNIKFVIILNLLTNVRFGFRNHDLI